ncbi:MAG: hypothetical protein NC311_15555, partial [Muribaculaceae bacterium]|nr:hypothetical protein [Muribaculaceae bacterium]
KVRRIKSITYQIGKEEAKEYALKDTDRTKTSLYLSFARGTIVDDLKLTITLEDVPKYKVTFVYDSKKTDIDITSNKNLKLDKEDSVEVLEGSADAKRLTFKPSFKTPVFKVTGVTARPTAEDGNAGGAVLTVSEDGSTYSLRNITESFTVEITVGLDETKCNVLTIAADGHSDAFRVSIGGFLENDDDYDLNKTYSGGDKVLTGNYKLTATINIEEGYQLKDVKLNGTELAA